MLATSKQLPHGVVEIISDGSGGNWLAVLGISKAVHVLHTVYEYTAVSAGTVQQ